MSKLACLFILVCVCFSGAACSSSESDIDRAGLTAEEYYDLGMNWMVNKRPERAEIVFRKAISMKPNFAEAYIKLGYAYYFMYEQYTTSSEYKQKASEYYNLSYNCLQEGLKYKPEDPECHAGLGRLAIVAGRYDQAIKHLLDARQYTLPGEVDMEEIISYELGRCYFEQGKYQESLKEYKEYIEIAAPGTEYDLVKKAIDEIEKLVKEPAPTPVRGGAPQKP